MQYSEQNSPVVKVEDLMTQPLISLDENQSVMEAARIMTQRNVSSVLVSRRNEICGIITDHDIISRVVALGLDPNSVKAARVMSRPLKTISDNLGIDEAAKKMTDEKVRRLIVVRNSKIVGIIGESDIIRIEPELHFLIREQSKLKPNFQPSEGRDIILGGYCEECGNYSPLLMKVEGRWLDEDCTAYIWL
jgi:signal-transduction protein with cAMP-binding, CBS, and nucleotidyltransferase domain